MPTTTTTTTIDDDNARPHLPTVLILGGLNTVARHLVVYLLLGVENGRQEKEVGEEGKGRGRVKHLRIVDKPSVAPPTTYLDATFRRCLESPRVEYRQANLALPDKVAAAFEPPTGCDRWDHVFDLTGDVGWDRPEMVHIQQSYRLPLGLARHAASLPAAQRPAAYVRLTYPFYSMRSSQPATGYTEAYPLTTTAEQGTSSRSSGLAMKAFSRSSSASIADDAMRPDGVRGRWWHEALRVVAGVKGLNAAVVRCAEIYGEDYTEGGVLARLVIGDIYRHTGEEMKFLHDPDLRVHTVHVVDVCRALVATAEWMVVQGRARADEIAGERVVPARTGSRGAEEEQLVEEGRQVRVPIFNVVDSGDSTQDSIARAVSSVFGIKYGFHGKTVMALVSAFAKSDLSDAIQDVNEKHMEDWAEMLASSGIADTCISPYLDEHAFKKLATNLDGRKLRRVLNWQPLHPRITSDLLRPIVAGFQEAHMWPRS